VKDTSVFAHPRWALRNKTRVRKNAITEESLDY